MLTRLATLLKVFFNTLMGKSPDPEMELERSYQGLQDRLIQVRRELHESVEKERVLERQLKKKGPAGKGIDSFESELQARREVTASLKSQLAELESDLQRAYTKKQVLIARDKSNQEMRHQDRLGLTNPMEKEVGTLIVSRQPNRLPPVGVILLLIIFVLVLVVTIVLISGAIV